VKIDNELRDLERLGCHCVERWYGDLRFGRVATCPFHGQPFEAMLRGDSPAKIQADNDARLARAKALKAV
jgi:hypothetical protein